MINTRNYKLNAQSSLSSLSFTTEMGQVEMESRKQTLWIIGPTNLKIILREVDINGITMQRKLKNKAKNSTRDAYVVRLNTALDEQI